MNQWKLVKKKKSRTAIKKQNFENFDFLFKIGKLNGTDIPG